MNPLLDKLFSIKELEEILPDNDIRGYNNLPYPLSHVMAKQLLNTLRENEVLRKLVDSYALASYSPQHTNKDSGSEWIELEGNPIPIGATFDVKALPDGTVTYYRIVNPPKTSGE